MHQDDDITLTPVPPGDRPAFRRALQDAFAPAAIAAFGPLDEPIPSDADLDGAMTAAGAEVLHIRRGDVLVGGAVVGIDAATQHNSLDFFFIAPAAHDRGLGLAAWRAIERRYPMTRVWRTHTPYFEKRNIHFYVNKCGFRIVAFYNAHHPDPHRPDNAHSLGLDEAFLFEKT
ncbi:MAG: hypothetical protein RLZZ501_677, partial [Pseudomonadota bacterium]